MIMAVGLMRYVIVVKVEWKLRAVWLGRENVRSERERLCERRRIKMER
jgi:hypothetical protein